MRMLAVVVLALSCFSCANAEEGGGTTLDSSTTDTARSDSSGSDTRVGADDGVDSATALDSGVDAAIDSALDSATDTATDGATTDTLDAREVAIDTAPPTGLRIDEIYVDRDLSGDKVEFVEIAGAPLTALDGLHLRLLDATGRVKYDVAITTGKTIGASGRFVVGGNGVITLFGTDVDQSVGIASWGLDNTAGAVQLISGTTLLDVIGYGAKVAAPATAPTATYETDAATLPSTLKQSLARNAGIDTGNNATDFCKQAGSPGSAGGACL